MEGVTKKIMFPANTAGTVLVCPLCNYEDCSPYHEDNYRPYFQCHRCQLVFVPSEYQITPAQEKAVYDLHQNDERDERYRKFLSRLADPLAVRIADGSRGLDYGCGPAPALVRLFEERGCVMKRYDPLYWDHSEALEDRYDFVCATEVVEHFREPGKEFKRLFSLLTTGGYLGLMTKLVLNRESFRTWHYIRDLTHICFYSRLTFTYMADCYDYRCTFIGNDVILFECNENSSLRI